MPDAPRPASGPAAAAAAETVAAALDDAGVDWESPAPGAFVATLPGTRKLSTTCSLVVGAHTLSVNAFVVRRPDENHAAFHRWLLERNTRLPGIAFSLDRLGDVYLVGRAPLRGLTADHVDALLGAVLDAADGSFNVLLELGFASSIRREWEWRTKRGLPTANLAAFAHLAEPDAAGAHPDAAGARPDGLDAPSGPDAPSAPGRPQAAGGPDGRSGPAD